MKSVCPECGKSYKISDYPPTSQQQICPECGAAFDVETNLSFEEESGIFGQDSAPRPLDLPAD